MDIRAQTMAEKVLEVLYAREIPVSEQTRHLLARCEDLISLEHWLDRARKASSVDEVLEPQTE